MKEHQKKEGNRMRRYYEPPQSQQQSEQHHTQHVVVRKAMPIGVDAREINQKMVWGDFRDKDNSKILAIGFAPPDERYNDKKNVTTHSLMAKTGVNLFKKTGTKTKGLLSPMMMMSRKSTLTSSAQIAPERTTNEIENSKKDAGMSEKIIQILITGVWVFKTVAPNICEVRLAK